MPSLHSTMGHVHLCHCLESAERLLAQDAFDLDSFP